MGKGEVVIDLDSLLFSLASSTEVAYASLHCLGMFCTRSFRYELSLTYARERLLKNFFSMGRDRSASL